MLIAFSYSRTVACANGREKRELAVIRQLARISHQDYSGHPALVR